MAEPKKELKRTVFDYLLYFLVIVYAFNGASGFTYTMTEDISGRRSGLNDMLSALGIREQINYLYGSGAFSISSALCLLCALYFAPKWGCWYMLGMLSLLFLLAINLYLVIAIMRHHWSPERVAHYLRTLDADSAEGKIIWDNLQYKYSCCGVHDEDEWESKPEGCPDFSDYDSASETHGCAPKFVESYGPRNIALSIVLIIMIILALLGFITSCFLLWPYFLSSDKGAAECLECSEDQPENFSSANVTTSDIETGSLREQANKNDVKQLFPPSPARDEHVKDMANT